MEIQFSHPPHVKTEALTLKETKGQLPKYLCICLILMVIPTKEIRIGLNGHGPHSLKIAILVIFKVKYM